MSDKHRTPSREVKSEAPPPPPKKQTIVRPAETSTPSDGDQPAARITALLRQGITLCRDCVFWLNRECHARAPLPVVIWPSKVPEAFWGTTRGDEGCGDGVAREAIEDGASTDTS